MSGQDGLDGLAVSVGEPGEEQHAEALAQQLRHDLVRARVVDAADAGEVDARDAGFSHDRLLDALAHRTARGTRDQVGVGAGYGSPQHGMNVDVLDHAFLVPCSGMMIRTCAPGKAASPSASGTSSSHDGVMLIRAVPLRIEIFPSHRLT